MQGQGAVLSTALVVLGALVIIALERRFPSDPRQRLLRDGFWNDLVLYSVIQSYLLGFVIAALVGWLDRVTGLSMIDPALSFRMASPRFELLGLVFLERRRYSNKP